MTIPLKIYTSTNLSASDCLGGRFSGNAFSGLYPWITSDTIECIKILGIKQYNDIKEYTITRDGNNYSLTVGGVTGSSVALSFGVPGVLTSGVYNVSVVIDRTVTQTEGTLTFKPLYEMNNAVGMSNIAAAASGVNTQYRCLFLYATENVWIKSFSAGLSQLATCSYSYYLNNTNSKLALTTDGSTSFSGVSWVSMPSTGLNIAISAGNTAILYLKKAHTSDGVDWYPLAQISITYATGSSGGTQETIHLCGRYLQPTNSASYKKYNLYAGNVSDSVGGTLLDSFNASDLPRSIVVSHPYNKKLRLSAAMAGPSGSGIFNKVRTLSNFLTDEANINASGVDILVPPSAENLVVSEIGGGAFNVSAEWVGNIQFETPSKFYITATGNKGYSESIEVNPGFDIDGRYYLDHNMPSASWNEEIAVNVSVSSIYDGVLKTSAVETEAITISEFSSQAVLSGAKTGSKSGFSANSVIVDLLETFGSATVSGSSETGSIYLSASELLRMLFSVTYTSYSLSDAGVSGTGTGLVEVSGSTVYLNVNGSRKVSLDTSGSVITAYQFRDSITTQCPIADAVYGDSTATWFQYYSEIENAWRTWLCVLADGTLEYYKDLYQS